MKGRARNADHRLLNADDEHKLPTLHVDYGFLGRKDAKANPVMFCKMSPWKVMFALVCLMKGPEDGHSVKAVAGFVRSIGCRHFINKSDQEPAIVSWKEALARELGPGYQVVLGICE